MAVPVRINEDNYQSLKELADKERRSVVAQLGVILDNYFHRDTVGQVSVNGGTPISVEPGGIINYKGKTPPSIVRVPEKIASEPSGSGALASKLPDAEDIHASNTEQPCCQHPTRPCKHWVWDNDSGEGYKNILSGRVREAD